VRTWARTRAFLQLEILALRHQLQVLQRTQPRRMGHILLIEMRPIRLSLLSGEEMTARGAVLSRSRGRLHVRSFRYARFIYAVARAFEKVAVLTKLFAMTPKPTQRFMPSSPW
jgi:hypothetical protein